LFNNIQSYYNNTARNCRSVIYLPHFITPTLKNIKTSEPASMPPYRNFCNILRKCGFVKALNLRQPNGSLVNYTVSATAHTTLSTDIHI